MFSRALKLSLFLSLIFSHLTLASGGRSKDSAAAVATTTVAKPLQKSLIILQGEVGFTHSAGGAPRQLFTSTPSSCFVISIYHPDSKSAFLAHIDSYTSIESVMSLAQTKFKTIGLDLKDNSFVVRVYGGNKAHDDSKEIFKQLYPHIKKLRCHSEVIIIERTAAENKCLMEGSMEDLPQLLLNPSISGELVPVIAERSAELELLQQCEYGDFNNNVLDIKYAGVPGSQIPYFAAREAVRTLAELPKSKYRVEFFNWEHKVQSFAGLESAGMIEVETNWDRSAFVVIAKCLKCGKAGAKYNCQRCNKAHYCNRKCSKAHWKAHKKSCGKS